jgi:hypothetical protein
MEARDFLRMRVLGLGARLGRLSRIDHASVGIRPQDRPYAPSASHFAAANQRLAQIEHSVRGRFRTLQTRFAQLSPERALVHIALVERELDRARRAYGLFFEVFGQRGTNFAPALAGHDTVASDCYQAVRNAAPEIFEGPLLKPLCYMEHGYSPATMRRGVTLRRLLGESNPFPIIRIPWDREHPWDAVFLHEVAHNLQADLRIWEENRHALITRLAGRTGNALAVRTYGRWHKEIFADLAAILLGGPAAAFGMAQFLAHPSPRTLTYRPGSAHPTAFLRVFMLTEMLRRLAFPRSAARLEQIWRTLYDPSRFHRLPPQLLSGARNTIAEVVDEIAFQTRRNLAQRALVDVIHFTPAHEAAIVTTAQHMIARRDPPDSIPPRFLLSAASYALGSGRVPAQLLSRQVLGLLNESRATSATATLVA